MTLKYEKIIMTLALIAITIGLIIVLFAPSSSDYEDANMTKAFLEKNKEKMKKVYLVEIFAQKKRRLSYYKLDFFKKISLYQRCSAYRVSLNRDELVFDIENIRELGKERMFLEAQRCLDAVVEHIEAEEKDKEKEEAERKRGIENEKKEFDISKVNN